MSRSGQPETATIETRLERLLLTLPHGKGQGS
jgi:hypothetical protein